MADQTVNQTAEPVRRNGGSKSPAEDLALEAKVQQALDAYKTGQFRSILAAAKAHGAPYHRTRSRCLGHHTRHQNGGNRTRRDGASDEIAQDGSGALSRRRRRNRIPKRSSLPGSILNGIASGAAAAGRSSLRGPADPAVAGECADHPSTQDLLKQLIKRFDKHEATMHAGAASLEQSLKDEFTKHITERDEEIKVLQDSVMDLEAMVVSQTEKIKHLEELIFERVATPHTDATTVQ